MTLTAPQTNFDYGVTEVGSLQVHDVQRNKGGRLHIKRLEIDGRVVNPTRRFWRSFFSRFGIAENVFRYFEPHEVFARISERNHDDAFRFCIEQSEDGHAKLLGVTSPSRPMIRSEEIRDLVRRRGAADLTYHEGIVTSTHLPGNGGREFSIGADLFQDRFVMETPVDGYGSPRLFLSLLRLVCSNGAIGYSRAFRSDIPTGKHMDHCIIRALESFDNGDGYAALRQRFESAQTSWASVRECLALGQTIEKLANSNQLTASGLGSRCRRMAGNLAEVYGLANLEALSDKRRRVLPAKCRIYDLINFASEIATHHAKHEAANRMQAFIGSLISDEYDLEGTAQTAGEFDAFFMSPDDQLPPASRN